MRALHWKRAVFLVCALSNAACSNQPAEETQQNVESSETDESLLPSLELSPEQESLLVLQAAVKAESVPRYVEAAGIVELKRSGVTELSSATESRIVRIEKEPGQSVKRGEVLFQLEASAVASARADVERSLARKELAERIADQEKALQEVSATSLRESNLAERELRLARADLAAAQGNLKAWGAGAGSGSLVILKAPHDGIVSRLSAAVGATVEAGTILARIVDPKALTLSVFVSPGQSNHIASGQSLIRLGSDPESRCFGSVLGHNMRVDPMLAAVPFRVLPEEDCARILLEGARVVVNLPLLPRAGDAGFYKLPASAMSSYRGEPIVFGRHAGTRAFVGLKVADVEIWDDQAFFRFQEAPPTEVVVSGILLLKGELMRGDLE